MSSAPDRSNKPGPESTPAACVGLRLSFEDLRGSTIRVGPTSPTHMSVRLTESTDAIAASNRSRLIAGAAVAATVLSVPCAVVAWAIVVQDTLVLVWAGGFGIALAIAAVWFTPRRLEWRLSFDGVFTERTTWFGRVVSGKRLDLSGVARVVLADVELMGSDTPVPGQAVLLVPDGVALTSSTVLFYRAGFGESAVPEMFEAIKRHYTTRAGATSDGRVGI